MKTNRAFTLAETLITLLVIGIISAIVLPVFNSGIKDNVNDSRQKNFTSKIKEGLRRMQINGELSKEYSSTADFISVMQKYIQVAKVCDSETLSECFTSKILEAKNLPKFTTSELHTSEDIDALFAEASDLKGLIFADGVNAIFTHDNNCVITNNYDVNADTTSCIAVIFDTNGKEGPNIIGEDIRTINLPYGDAMTDYEMNMGEVYLVNSAQTAAECQAAKASGAPITYCRPDNNGYYTAAITKCYNEGKQLPTPTDLQDLAYQLYGKQVSLGTTTGLKIVNKNLWNKLGGSTVYLYSNIPNGDAFAGTMVLNTNTAVYVTGDSRAWANTSSGNRRFFCVNKH